jgi:hypothetical protein
MQKLCKRCQEWKPFTDYHCNRAARDGRRDVCKACATAKTQQWRRENPEKQHHWEDAHRETRLARKRQQHHDAGSSRLDQMRRWRALNPDTQKAAVRRWEAAHRGQRLAYLRARLFMETGPMLHCLAWQDFQPIYDRAATLTRETGIQHHVDHIVPLNHPLVCGLHVPANLQVLTAKENRAKRNTFNVEIG